MGKIGISWDSLTIHGIFGVKGGQSQAANRELRTGFDPTWRPCHESGAGRRFWGSKCFLEGNFFLFHGDFSPFFDGHTGIIIFYGEISEIPFFSAKCPSWGSLIWSCLRCASTSPSQVQRGTGWRWLRRQKVEIQWPYSYWVYPFSLAIWVGMMPI